MSYEQLIEKIKALPEFQLENVGMYIDSLKTNDVDAIELNEIHDKILEGIDQAHAGKLIDGNIVLNSLTEKYGL